MRHFVKRAWAFSLVLVLGGLAGRAVAQPLAEQVPADAIVYIGWKGSDAMPPAYAQSHLKAVLDASNFPELVNDFLPRVLERIGQQDRNAAEKITLIANLAAAVGHHPTAVYLNGIDWSNPRQPMPRMGILCQAGAQGPELAARLNRALAGKPKDVPITVEEKNGLVTMHFGSALAAAQAAGSLATAKAFTEALGQVQKAPVVIGYVNGQRLLGLIDEAVEHGHDANAQQNWPKLRDALGLGGFERLVWTGAFEGKQWGTRAFVAAPAPRTGLLTLLDTKPLDTDLLKSVPQGVTLFAAGQLDLARLVDELRTAAGKVDPNAQQQFDQTMNQIHQMLGLDVQKDFLATLGSGWAYYLDPASSGTSIMGLTVLNRLKDPAKAEASLSQLERFANDMIRHQIHDPKVTVRFEQTKAGALTIHYLATPLITPAWTIADGNLYIAMYPQVVVAAAQSGAASLKEGGKSILDNAGFVALRQQLGDQQASGIGFADLPQTAPTAYGSWLILSRYAGFGDLFGVRSPVMILPSLKTLLAELSPAGQVCWTDETGWHSRGLEPFPGSQSLATDPMAGYQMMQPAMMMSTLSVLLPSLNRAREMADRAKGLSNLRQIGLGLLLYSNENHGKYPDTLGDVAATQDLSTKTFFKPGHVQNPPAAVLADRKKLVDWINANTDYVYLGKGKVARQVRPDEVLAYEKHGPGDEGVNVLFGDGHCEWMTVARFNQTLHTGHAPPGPAGGL